VCPWSCAKRYTAGRGSSSFALASLAVIGLIGLGAALKLPQDAGKAAPTA